VRLLVEQLRNSLFYRWFAGLEVSEEFWRCAVFGKNIHRLLNEQVAGEFFRRERPALL
jgi:transposase